MKSFGTYPYPELAILTSFVDTCENSADSRLLPSSDRFCLRRVSIITFGPRLIFFTHGLMGFQVLRPRQRSGPLSPSRNLILGLHDDQARERIVRWRSTDEKRARGSQ